MTRDTIAEFTIRTDNVVICLRGMAANAWCSGCDARVGMLVVPAHATREDLRAIQCLAGSEHLHVEECPDGALRVCLNGRVDR